MRRHLKAVFWLLMGCLLMQLVLADTAQAMSTTQKGPFIIMWRTPGDGSPLAAFGPPTTPEWQEIHNGTTPTREMTAPEKASFERAVTYWAERMAGAFAGATTRIDLGFIETEGGTAFSMTTQVFAPESIKKLISADGIVVDSLRDGKPSPLPAGVGDNMLIFEQPFSTATERLLLHSDSSTGVMMHEMGHALGIVTSYAVAADGQSGQFTHERFTTWNSHLVDVFGKQAKPGMRIETSAGSGNKAGVFQVFNEGSASLEGYKYPTFHGTHVDALTGGAGMAVMGAFNTRSNALDGANALGHPGIMQSIMSYSVLKNMVFTELELAMFQDLGYTIDRSQFFGKSYYLNVGGNSQTNALGFGTAEKPNTASFGLGLHIMRNDLTLTQTGSIYASGYGAGGMRIDGVGNNLTLPKGVTVAVNGELGTGVLVSYGNGNTLDLAGRILATGPGGIAIHAGIKAAPSTFYSYGTATLEPYVEADGTFMPVPAQKRYEVDTINRDLNGALIKRMDLRGEIIGSEAAIKIGADTHVETIAVHDGASISGHILSDWARNTVTERHATSLLFGDAGTSGAMTLTGNITWTPKTTFLKKDVTPVNSIDVTQQGGLLRFNGAANVYGWRINEGATLTGNSTLKMEGETPLINAGTIAPGNSIGRISVEGGYRQTPTGSLNMEFTHAASDVFAVKGTAEIRGSLNVTPLPAYYPTGVGRTLTNANLFENTLNQAAFDSVSLAGFASPTLTASVSRADAGINFNVHRPANAYSRYAAGDNGRGVGSALERLASNAPLSVQGDMQNLYAALDFSTPDGSTVRSGLSQLAPSIYDSTASASLDDNRAFAATLFHNLLNAPRAGSGSGSGGLAGGTTQPAGVSELEFFMLPYAGWSSQTMQNDNPGYSTNTYGVVAGLNRQFDAGVAGVHVAFGHREVDSRSGVTGRSRADAFRVGAHAQYWATENIYVSGVANIGLENTDIRRDVSVDGFWRNNKADFTAMTALAAVRTGYEWQFGNVRLGPLAGLEYAAYHRRSLTEKDGGASRMWLDADTTNSLRTQLGAQVHTSFAASESVRVRGSFEALWSHDLLGSAISSQVAFADYRQMGFGTRMPREGRDALVLQGSLGLDINDNLTLSAFGGTEVFRKGHTAGQAGVAAEWRF